MRREEFTTDHTDWRRISADNPCNPWLKILLSSKSAGTMVDQVATAPCTDPIQVRFVLLRSEDRGTREAEGVLNGHPLRHRLPALHCRLEFDLARRQDRVLSQSVRKPSHYSYAIELAVAEQQYLEHNQTFHADSSRFACVTGIGPRLNLRFNVNFFLGVTRGLIVIEQMGERAVVSAAIVLVLLSRDLRSWWQ